jgi:hypothetical protein
VARHESAIGQKERHYEAFWGMEKRQARQEENPTGLSAENPMGVAGIIES